MESLSTLKDTDSYKKTTKLGIRHFKHELVHLVVLSSSDHPDLPAGPVVDDGPDGAGLGYGFQDRHGSL